VAAASGFLDFLFGLSLIVAAVVLYFLPTIVAYGREVSRPLLIAVINVLLGWTLIGWVIAIVMAARRASTTSASTSVRSTVASPKSVTSPANVLLADAKLDGELVDVIYFPWGEDGTESVSDGLVWASKLRAKGIEADVVATRVPRVFARDIETRFMMPRDRLGAAVRVPSETHGAAFAWLVEADGALRLARPNDEEVALPWGEQVLASEEQEQVGRGVRRVWRHFRGSGFRAWWKGASWGERVLAPLAPFLVVGFVVEGAFGLFGLLLIGLVLSPVLIPLLLVWLMRRRRGKRLLTESGVRFKRPRYRHLAVRENTRVVVTEKRIVVCAGASVRVIDRSAMNGYAITRRKSRSTEDNPPARVEVRCTDWAGRETAIDVGVITFRRSEVLDALVGEGWRDEWAGPPAPGLPKALPGT
jgi:Superinfection immunity protein